MKRALLTILAFTLIGSVTADAKNKPRHTCIQKDFKISDTLKMDSTAKQPTGATTISSYYKISAGDADYWV